MRIRRQVILFAADLAAEGWPQRWSSSGSQMALDGRPTAQWSRIKAGRNDDLGATSGGHSGQHCH